jgi:tRNA(fMet)-specific endonuclease VapC
MRRHLLDTGVASAFVNRQAKVLGRVREATARGDRVGIGFPVLGELWARVELSTRRDKNESLLKNALGTLFLWPFDAAAARQYGRVFAELRRIGRPMQQVDMQIAAMALAFGNAIVVSPDSDLSAVPRLDVENWLTE